MKLDKFVVDGPGAQAQKDYKDAMKETQRVADSIKAVMATDGFKADKQAQFNVQIRISNMFIPMTDQLDGLSQRASGYAGGSGYSRDAFFFFVGACGDHR
ncbi:hypothetical protein ACQ86N_23425 [Puia sp. P3]|uniref:hypothetical protein n=1 Tax=Puia sp. P3 TaxID=3423952 RepID=UPI003D676299